MAQHHEDSDHEAITGAPWWVKVCGGIALILVVLFIGLHLTGHAPMGHGG